MLAIDLTNFFVIESSINSKLEGLKSEEFCFINLPGLNKIDQKLSNIIYKAISKSNKVCLTISLDDFIENPLENLFNQFQCHSFCIKIKTNPEKFAPLYNQGGHNSGDRDLYHLFEKKMVELPINKELALEFNDEIDFRIMGSTISALYYLGCSWVHFKIPNFLTKAQVEKYHKLFNFLRMRDTYKLNIYFDFFSAIRDQWQLHTKNTFSGLRDVHIDLSNKCTHSCTFCGLYSESAQQHYQKNPAVTKHLQMEIDGNKAMEIIQSLPFDVELIQFGGLGDPLIHPMAYELIVQARQRGFKLEILSNMEYLDADKIKKISSLGSRDGMEINFIVNISGGSASTYQLTRPKQTEKTFIKVTENLKLFTETKAITGRGVNILLMCVVNKYNYNKLLEFAKYATEINADSVWFKPMELHSEFMRPSLCNDEQVLTMQQELKAAIAYLDTHNISIHDRIICEQLIK